MTEASAVAQQPRWQPLTPLQALSTFELDSTFRIELVASEPLIEQPIAMVFDESGRLFAAETPSIATDSADGNGRIKLLEDTDGDGVFDTAGVYLDKLARPCALACWDGGLYVLDTPNLLFCRDTDSDGRADRVSTVITGFAAQSQALPVSLGWGADNRLHGESIAAGGLLKIAGAPNAKPVDPGGLGFVLDPRAVHIAADCFPGSRGMAFDIWGRRYFSPDDGSLQIGLCTETQRIPGGRGGTAGEYAGIADEGASIPVFPIGSAESPDAGGVPAAAQHSLYVSGLVVYQGDAWPIEYRDCLYVLDSRNNLIHRRTLDDTGLAPRSQRPEQTKEFVRSSDTGFRPVQCAGGPDGNLYVLDRYGLSPESPDSNSGNRYGRIYRVAPRSFAHEKRVMPGSVSGTGLVDMLEHTNAWHRETAARMIYASQEKNLIPSLQTLANKSTAPYGRIGALHALAGLSALDNEVLARAMSDEEAAVRAHALRLAVPRLATDARLMGNVTALAGDRDVRVRYEAACHINSVWLEERVAPVVRLCRLDGADPRFSKVLASAARDVAHSVLRELVAVPEYLATPENAPLLHSLARLTMLSRRGFDSSFAPNLLSSLPEDAGEIRKLLAAGFVDGAVAAGRWGALKRLVQADGPTAEVVAQLLIEAQSTATDPSAPLDDRLSAIGLLSSETFENAGGLLAGLIVQSEPVEVQTMAIQSLSLIGNPRMVPLILGAWFNLGPRVRWQAMDKILGNGVLALALLEAVENGAMDIESLVRWGILDLARHPNSVIRNPASRLLAQREIQENDRIAAAYNDIRTLQPSVPNGRALFENNCSKCHYFDGMGYRVGPDLDYMANAGTYQLLKSISSPNTDVLTIYYSYSIETNDFQTVAGIIAAEEENYIVVHGPGGEEHTITRDNIASLTCTDQSLMPEGWPDALGKQGLADLIGYLVETSQKAKI